MLTPAGYAEVLDGLGAADITALSRVYPVELNGAQGSPVDTGGYYFADRSVLDQAMRPSPTFNRIIDDAR